MSNAWSDPTRNTTTMAATDLLALLRVDASTVAGFDPKNIAFSDFAAATVASGLLTLMASLPTTAPSGGGLWLNAGALSYSPITGTESGAILTTAAQQASYAAWLAALPTTDPGTGVGNFWNNNGVVTESVAS